MYGVVGYIIVKVYAVLIVEEDVAVNKVVTGFIIYLYSVGSVLDSVIVRCSIINTI